MGHSTGGLTSAYFESRCHPKEIKALILNSPFLDWNLGWKERIIPAVCMLGKLFPNFKISQGISTAYAESLLKDYHGEWNYRTDWKFTQSPPVTAGWVRAITQAQKGLRNGKADIRIPILLLYSSRSVNGEEWTPEHNRADGVLDVNDIKNMACNSGQTSHACASRVASTISCFHPRSERTSLPLHLQLAFTKRTLKPIRILIS